MPEDYPFLRQMEMSSPMAHRWRFRGAVLSPEEWAQASSQGMLAQFMVVEKRQHHPIGLVYFYSPSFQDGFAWLAAARFGAGDPSPLVILGLGLAVNYAFTCWNFRKLYMEVPEYNYSQFASSAARWCETGGRLREHWYFDGKLWDVLTLALYRERWMEIAPKLLAAEAPPEPSATRPRTTPAGDRRVVVGYR
jgi:hypothetical protein